MELTMPFPCRFLSPVSNTVHLDESTITGTLEISGSAAIRRKNVSMAFSESNNPSSIFTSIIWAPFSICWRATESASSYLSSLIRRRNLAEPVTLVLSPIFTKLLSGRMVTGSRPLNFVNGLISGTFRGEIPSTSSAMALMCAGVVPQHPPTRLTRPLSANSLMILAIVSGDSSYSPNSLGSPALGYTNVYMSPTEDSSSSHGRICTAPRAQLRPTAVKSAWRMEYQNASTVCPESVRPLASVIVPETKIGISTSRSSNNSRTAKSAALQFRVSNTVSIRYKSTPPSKRPLAWSLYASFNSSKAIFLNPGLLTSGPSEAVRLVGPRAPATKRGLSANSFTTDFAILAAS